MRDNWVIWQCLYQDSAAGDVVRNKRWAKYDSCCSSPLWTTSLVAISYSLEKILFDRQQSEHYPERCHLALSHK